MPLARPSKVPVQFPQSYGQLPTEGMDLQTFIETLENDLIRQALERTGNNRNQAAKLLGLNRTTLVERIKKRKLTTLNEPSKEL
jgi:transcriptional regulator with PAS, ATPase and Fis domain